MYKFYIAVHAPNEFKIFNNWMQYEQWNRVYHKGVKGFETIEDAILWLKKKGISVVKTDFPKYLQYTEPFVFEPRIRTHKEPIVKKDDVVIYTDGSCLSNPNGPGGFASIILLPDGKEVNISGYDCCTTNNRMEIMAAITSLDWIMRSEAYKYKIVKLVSDSQYLCDIFNKQWIAHWKQNGWKTIKGTNVINKDLIEILDWLVLETNTRFIWRKGHNGGFNEKVDNIAVKQAKTAAKKGEWGNSI